MKTVCCVCQKTKISNGWRKQMISNYKEVSHGFCPVCYEVTMQKIMGNKTSGGELKYRKVKVAL